MKVLSITPSFAKNNATNFGARFTVTPEAIKQIRENNYYIGYMENDFSITENLNKKIGKIIYDTATEFSKRQPENFTVILGKLPNHNLVLKSRPVVYKLDNNKEPVECMVEIPYTPQRMSRLKKEALNLLENITLGKPTKRINLK